MSEEINYISQKGLNKLLAEQEQLIRVERPEITKLVQWAASLGDRSENADYLYGKKRLREIDRRLRFLAKRISLASVVNFLENKECNKVLFGATVFLEDEQGVEKKVILVGVDEIDTSLNKLSWKSPFGRSLLNKVIGDEIQVKVPNADKVEYSVVHVEYKEWD